MGWEGLREAIPRHSNLRVCVTPEILQNYPGPMEPWRGAMDPGAGAGMTRKHKGLAGFMAAAAPPGAEASTPKSP